MNSEQLSKRKRFVIPKNWIELYKLYSKNLGEMEHSFVIIILILLLYPNLTIKTLINRILLNKILHQNPETGELLFLIMRM